MQGTCKFLHPSGFGFVQLTEADLIHAEYFFHRDRCLGPLPRKGDTVEFLLDDGVRGLVATQVRRLGYTYDIKEAQA